MSYINTNDSFGSFVKHTSTSGQYVFSYSTLSLNASISDQDQLIVIRKFTPSSTFEAAAAPDGPPQVAHRHAARNLREHRWQCRGATPTEISAFERLLSR